MTEIEQFLEKFPWETSEDNTHQYYICAPENLVEFENLVTHIRKNGYVVTFQGSPYVCVDIGEYLYWTMWESIEKVNIINRMHV